MTDQILISESMLDHFESTWRRRRRMARDVMGDIARPALALSILFLVFAVAALFAGNEVFGLTVLACLPMPSVATGIVLLVARRDARKADEVLLMIDGIRRRGPTTGG